MKPTHEYYNITELIEKWSVHDKNINETDILKWGASGQLQFSMWISTGEYYDHIDIIQAYQDGIEKAKEGLLEGKKVQKLKSCKEIRIDRERKIWKLSKSTVEFLLDDKKQDTVFPELLLDCDGCESQQCDDTRRIRIQPTLATWWLREYPDYISEFCDSRRENPQFSYLYISKEDLVVSHEDMKQFEKEYYKPEIPTPPYLDPTHPAYNVELALAIETWEALFIHKSHIDEGTAKQATQKYLEKYLNYSGDDERYTRYSETDTITKDSPFGRISILLNTGLLNKNAWKELKSKHSEETPET